ncbi:MAG TPA: helix-hairpin-helix domain-containing protein [Lacipirellulaceae bacterium]
MAEKPAKQMEKGSTPRSKIPATASRPLLKRADQAAVATLVAFALVGMGVYWFVQGGHRGELIEIDRAEPLTARFLVDINSAEWPELAELPEIGEILARRIVESRQQRGAFMDHDDLQRVRGIGPLTLEKLRPYLLPMPDQEDVAESGMPLVLPVP